ADPAPRRDFGRLGLPPAVVVVEHAVEERTDQEDVLAAHADGMERRPGDRAAHGPFRLLDLADRRPLLAVEVRPEQLDEVVPLPLLPETGDPLTQRHQARLLERVAEADTLFVRMDRLGEHTLVFRPPLPRESVVVGVADVDAVGAEPPDEPVGGPEPA